MTRLERIKRLQAILGTVADGVFGPKSQQALDTLINEKPIAHAVRASSFADKADVISFKKWFQIYKDQGLSDEAATKAAFYKGDNAVGCYGDDTSEGSGPSCALPPEDSEERWGSVNNAKHKLVEVTANNKTITCVLKDRMPRRANIKNNAGIDLNPDAVKELGLTPPIMTEATWRWI